MSQETSLTIAKPRGRPFQKGNPGRPLGSRNKTSAALAALLDGQAEAITNKVIELALEGDRAALRLCFERLVGAPPERTVSFEMPRISCASDGAAALSSVVAAVGAGEVSPREGAAVVQLIESTVRLWQESALEKRIEALEASTRKE